MQKISETAPVDDPNTQNPDSYPKSTSLKFSPSDMSFHLEAPTYIPPGMHKTASLVFLIFSILFMGLTAWFLYLGITSRYVDENNWPLIIIASLWLISNVTILWFSGKAFT
jgi:hypothetical protein